MTSLINPTGGALNFDGASWPVALRWLSKTGWRINPAEVGPGQTPRIDVTVVDLDQVQAREELTAREMQVLIGISQGKRNAAIGEWLHLSEDTIKTHARTMFRKMGANDRAHAVSLAYQRGLLGGPR